ncbi:hypothetical protein E4U39_008019 [Claviceps sp. Clav50 group G5]|nr:hypothetical protein E4U39_008019 [Claviceps sp. Clav50 group G5]
MAKFPEDMKYFAQYMLKRPTTFGQTLPNHVRWPEGSGESGEILEDPLPSVGSCESERLPRKRSSSTSSAELRGQLVDSVKQKYAKADDGVIDYEKGSHDAQLKREKNAQASKRSRTRSKTMQQRLDESEKGRKLAEEESRQDRELRLKAEEKARQAQEKERQEREQRLQAEEGIRQRDKEIERLKKPK